MSDYNKSVQDKQSATQGLPKDLPYRKIANIERNMLLGFCFGLVATWVAHYWIGEYAVMLLLLSGFISFGAGMSATKKAKANAEYDSVK